ncbi:MAG: hypothetical protein Kow00133_08880 [Amphiplicatus sp.]
MIALEEHGVGFGRLQRGEPLDDAAAVGPPVDIIAKKDETLAGGPGVLCGDHLQKTIEQVGAAVDVAHRVKARSGGRGGLLTFHAEKFFEHRFNKRLQSFYSMEKSGDRVKEPSRPARRPRPNRKNAFGKNAA